LLEQPLPEQRYDLIYTLLTLHHIQDVNSIISKFSEILTKQGTLVIIDLEKEDGSFHDDEFHGHKGFDRDELNIKLNDAGLFPKHYEICYELEKEHNGAIRKYPLFMLIAQK
jgi:ubiquinone/menaquinone biosynthesis C-methylase UbiE